MEEDIYTQIDQAANTFDIEKLHALTNLPRDVLMGQRVMGRKERREWYRANKKDLRLPEWSKLDTLLNEK